MDNVQTNAEHCPAFLGCAPLQTFHKGAFAVHGGLAAVAEQLAEYIKVSRNEDFLCYPIHLVDRKNEVFQLHTKRKKIYEVKKVIPNNSVHNLHDTLSKGLGEQSFIKEVEEKKKAARSAFIIHAGVGKSVPENEGSLSPVYRPLPSKELHDKAGNSLNVLIGS